MVRVFEDVKINELCYLHNIEYIATGGYLEGYISFMLRDGEWDHEGLYRINDIENGDDLKIAQLDYSYDISDEIKNQTDNALFNVYLQLKFKKIGNSNYSIEKGDHADKFFLFESYTGNGTFKGHKIYFDNFNAAYVRMDQITKEQEIVSLI